MDKICRVMMNLIGSEVCGNAVCTDEVKALSDEELKALYKLSKLHDLAHLVGNALIKNNLLDDESPNGDENHDGDKKQGDGENRNVDKGQSGDENHSGAIRNEVKQKFEKQILTAIYRYENINSELESLKATFEEEKIPFIPLKGSVIRQYYPEPWMRTSCDIDILVHEEDLENAVSLLVERYGATREAKGSHDVGLILNGVHIELHYSLIESDTVGKADIPLQNVWSYAQSVNETSLYTMNDEMFYYYHIAHMAKHFIHGGCGVRPFADLWLYKRINNGNTDKRNELLSDGGLLKFSEEAENLAAAWFGNKEYNATTQKMENYILQGGVYGTLEQHIAMSQNKRGGKFKHLMSRIFLSYKDMLIYYPSLKKCPILFPFYQVRRWGRILFCGGRKTAMNEIKVNANMDKSKVEAAKRLIKELEL